MTVNPETHLFPLLAIVLTTPLFPVGLWLLEDENELPQSCEFLSSPCLVLWVQCITGTAEKEEGKG